MKKRKIVLAEYITDSITLTLLGIALIKEEKLISFTRSSKMVAFALTLLRAILLSIALAQEASSS